MSFRYASNQFKCLRAAAAFLLAFVSLTLSADHTPDPASVTVAGSLQSELGCPGDWQPDCAVSHLAYDADDDVWQGVFNVPAGSWEYKAPLNDSWAENYGAGGVQDGANIALSLGGATSVKFYYDHKTHWITDNTNSEIVTAAGNFQDEIGCPGDWQPWCLRSWLQDPDGDGIFAFETSRLPAGNYEMKAAHDEDWAENYGDGGVPGGANIPFTVPQDCADLRFEYDLSTHLLGVGEAAAEPEPSSVTVAGNLQSELGCPGDWQPDCAVTHLGFDPDDRVWQGTFNVPAGDWEYKASLNDSWDLNYGANATQNGPNIPFSLAAATDVKFYFSNETKWITSNQNAVIAAVAGNFQDEIGCPGDWQPWCLRSWLQDPDGDGIYSFSTGKLPAGNYEAKVAHNESWDQNYGQDGAPGGANIPFTVPASCIDMFFTYDPVTHILTVGTVPQTDSDGDGVPDDQDICPGGDDSVDTDNDLVPDFCDSCPIDFFNDSDGDGSCDSDDLCLGNDNTGDSDSDGLCDDSDPCIGASNTDVDADGICDEGDLCFGDDASGNSDGDGVCDDLDQCLGDDATGDTDSDLVCDDIDICILDAENDADADGICEIDDNCDLVSNPDQADCDTDGIGDACDADRDNDGIDNDADNCPLHPNANQADFDGDGEGDACDTDSDADGVLDSEDACLATPLGSVANGDGCSIGDLCPCENNWKNHGAYVRCVSHTANDFVDQLLIGITEHGDIVSQAAELACGKKN